MKLILVISLLTALTACSGKSGGVISEDDRGLYITEITQQADGKLRSEGADGRDEVNGRIIEGSNCDAFRNQANSSEKFIITAYKIHKSGLVSAVVATKGGIISPDEDAEIGNISKDLTYSRTLEEGVEIVEEPRQSNNGSSPRPLILEYSDLKVEFFENHMTAYSVLNTQSPDRNFFSNTYYKVSDEEFESMNNSLSSLCR